MPRKPDPPAVRLDPDTPAFLTKQELARVLRRSERTIDRLRSSGHFPEPVPLPGLILLWSRDRINAWMGDL